MTGVEGASAVERRTKIIATLGPASASRDTIGRMVAAGMDVARLNFSHGTHESHAELIRWVREAADEHGRAVAILQDIQGPRIRVGSFPGGSVELQTGQTVELVDGDGEGDGGRIHIRHLAAAHLEEGHRVLLADGLIEVEVTAVGDARATAVVRQGGILSSHKGAAFPATRLDLPAVTAKDVADLEFGRGMGIDLVAASFVEQASDVRSVNRAAPGTPVIAKIERASAYANLSSILEAADGAMVARGDLGVELGYETLPIAQKELIAAANAAGKISVTATEMLESMTASPRPTRAEVTDVANAIFDGTDAVMLSAETAVGRYPVRTIEVMSSICLAAESGQGHRPPQVAFIGGGAGFASAIAQAVRDAAAALHLRTVVAFTESGGTARLVSKYRPDARIIAFTPHPETYRQMAVMWGVEPEMFPRLDSTDEMIATAERILVERGIASPGERVAMSAGIPPNQRASTNLLKLHVIGESGRFGPAGDDQRPEGG